MNTYWLIEWKQQPEPHTFLHPEAEWLSRGVHEWTIESVRVEKWTKDVREAVRFPSKEDAEAVIGWLWGRDSSIYAATEHEDVGAPLPSDKLRGLVALRKAEIAAQTGPLENYERACAAFERAARDAIPFIEALLSQELSSGAPVTADVEPAPPVQEAGRPQRMTLAEAERMYQHQRQNVPQGYMDGWNACLDSLPAEPASLGAAEIHAAAKEIAELNSVPIADSIIERFGKEKLAAAIKTDTARFAAIIRRHMVK